MAEKAALLRVVLGGWMEGLGTEEAKNGAHGQSARAAPHRVLRRVPAHPNTFTAASNASEMIAGLSSSIGGPLQYLQAKPRVLLFRAEAGSTDAAALKKLPPALPPGTALGTAALGANEDDLATFLLPRTLRAASSLQAALLSSPTPRADGLHSVDTRLWRDRAALLADLEGLLAKMIGVLAESGVRLDWQGGDSAIASGMGKAREMVSEMIKLVRGMSASAPIQSARF